MPVTSVATCVYLRCWLCGVCLADYIDNSCRSARDLRPINATMHAHNNCNSFYLSCALVAAAAWHVALVLPSVAGYNYLRSPAMFICRFLADLCVHIWFVVSCMCKRPAASSSSRGMLLRVFRPEV